MTPRYQPERGTWRWRITWFFAAAHGLEWYGYGIGAGVRHGRFAFGHAGAVDGFKSDWNVYPDIRGTIISLTNDDRVDLSDLWLGLEEQIFAK